MECRPKFRQANLFPDMAMPGAASQRLFHVEGQCQQSFVGQIKSIASAAKNRLQPEVFEKPALFRSAKTYSPRDTAAGISRQTKSAIRGAEPLIMQCYDSQFLNVNQSVDCWAIGLIAQGSQRPRPTLAMARTTQSLTPSIERGQGFKSCNHLRVSKEGGVKRKLKLLENAVKCGS